MKHRSRGVLVALYLAALLTGVLWSPQAIGAQQILRDVTINFVEATRISNVRSEVGVYVSLTDLDGLPIKGLTQDHFTVTEDGVTVATFDVQKAVEGMWVVLMLDTTTSMGPAGLQAAKEAADGFVESMADPDQVALYEFQEEPILLEDFTHDHNRVRNAIAKLELVDKWTCLYDAAHAAVKKAMEIPRGRRAVVLMTDGRDNRDGEPCSTVSADDLITLAWTQRVPVYVIGLGKEIDEAVLKRIAEKTGGAYWAAPQPEDLEQAYTQIAELLQSQYLVTYESTGAGGEHALVIRVDYQGQQALDGVGFPIPPPPPLTPSVEATAVPTPSERPSPTQAPTPTEAGGAGRDLGTLIWLAPILAAVGAVALFAWSRRRKARPQEELFGEEIPLPIDQPERFREVDTDDTIYIPPVEEEVTREVPEAEVAQPLAKLTVLSSLELPEGESYELFGRSVYIGRGADNDIVIPDQPVSRSHAEMRYQGGEFYVYDRGSRFGTRVNGVVVPPQGVKLEDGDQLQLGPRTALRFTRLRVVRDEDLDRTQDVGSDEMTSDSGSA